MNYTLNQLRIFLKVSELKSVTKSAEELHLTQPAISIQLKNFQNQFDIPLYEIINRKIYITDFGNEIAKVAQEILDKTNNINNKTLAYKGILAGNLKISVVSTGKYVMPYFLADFINMHFHIKLNMTVTNKLNVLESLANNEVDFSLVSVLPKNLAIEKLSLLENKLFLIGSPKLKRAKKELKKNELADYHFIYREEGSATRKSMQEFIEKNKLPTKKTMELTSNEAVKQALIAGMGYSIMPLIGIKNELENQLLEIIPFKGLPIVSHWNLIWLKGKKLSPASLSFLDFITKEKERILKESFKGYGKFK